ncbi:VanZ family protein [Peribacillus sp. NPDC097675]|uniref:VanZ family protein n=1 Tax=Peribacillus sp. NPDC097675 TaxID=3390618 RepID=UPI003D07C89D
MTKKSLMLSLLLSQGLFFAGLPIFLQLPLYLNPWVIMVVWFCSLVFVALIVLWIRGETMTVSRWCWNLTIVTYSLSILVLLFFRPKGQEYSYNFTPFSTISAYLSTDSYWLVSLYNLSANILLFIPFGLFLLYKQGTMMPAIQRFLIPFFSILSIEMGQYVFQRGGFDIDDLFLNLTGVYLGYFLFQWFVKVIVILPKNQSAM